MRGSRTVELITAVSIHDGWVKLVQAEIHEKKGGRLLGIKARHVKDQSEVALAGALKELVKTLPSSSKEVLGLLSKRDILTRYLTLPSKDPSELSKMAFYQLEGLLPYPVEECVTSIKVIGPVGEATRVLVAAAHRPSVERLIRICAQAKLTLTSVAVSSEAIGQWHRFCRPESEKAASGAWLFAEITEEGMDLGVLDQGSPIYMRHVPQIPKELSEMAEQLHETLDAYHRERIGPSVERITVSGGLSSQADVAERLEVLLEMPVHRVDPLELSPFRESLAVTAKEFELEVSFAELLGVAAAPRLLELDLLPIETRIQEKNRVFFSQVRQTALLAVLLITAVLCWAGGRIGGNEWQLRQTQFQIRQLQPQADRTKGIFSSIRALSAARQTYAHQLQLLGAAASPLQPEMTPPPAVGPQGQAVASAANRGGSAGGGVTLQFLGLEVGKVITLRGTAPDLNTVTRFATDLRKNTLWEEVSLHSAKVRETAQAVVVEFELRLEPSRKETK